MSLLAPAHGAVTNFTFNGARSGLLGVNPDSVLSAYIASDAVPISVPVGGQVLMKSYLNQASGAVVAYGRPAITALGEGIQASGSGDTDCTTTPELLENPGRLWRATIQSRCWARPLVSGPHGMLGHGQHRRRIFRPHGKKRGDRQWRQRLCVRRCRQDRDSGRRHLCHAGDGDHQRRHIRAPSRVSPLPMPAPTPPAHPAARRHRAVAQPAPA